MRRTLAGFTLIELLIVLAIVGILAAVGWTGLNPPSAHVLSNDLKSMLYQSRYEAVKRNQPVAFVHVAADDVFQIRFDAGSTLIDDACDGDTVLTTKDPSEYRGASVDVNIPTSGIVWLPTGQGRTCSGAPMVGADIEVASGNVVRTVEVTLGGKVTIR